MTAIPTYSVTWPAGSTAYWMHANSPTTQQIGTTNGANQRMTVWDTAGGMPSALYSGREMWCLSGFRLVTGKPKRMLNWHLQPNDQPYGWSQPYRFGVLDPKTGTSPIAIDYPSTGGNPNMVIMFQSEQGSSGQSGGTGQYQIFTAAEAEARRGSWIWLWLWVRLGRQDNAPVDGACKVWVAGEDDSPRLNLTNINTYWPYEHQTTYWQGGYWSNNTTPAGGVVIEHALTRFGRTAQECFEDVPVFHSAHGATQTGGTGPGSATLIASRSHDEAAIPADIEWTSGGGGPNPPLQTNTRERRFGKTSPGVDRPTLTGDFKRASKFGTGLNPNDEYADVYDFHIFLEGYDGNAGSQRVTLGIYDDDGAGNGPGTKLGECSQEIDLVGNAPGGWQKVTSSTPIRISGEFVWLAAGSGLPTGRLSIASDQSVTDGLASNADTYEVSAPRLADPFGTIIYSVNELSICADYDVVAADVEAPDRTGTRTTAIARVSGTKLGTGGGI